jgi:hypothetical protein
MISTLRIIWHRPMWLGYPLPWIRRAGMWTGNFHRMMSCLYTRQSEKINNGKYSNVFKLASALVRGYERHVEVYCIAQGVPKKVILSNGLIWSLPWRLCRYWDELSAVSIFIAFLWSCSLNGLFWYTWVTYSSVTHLFHRALYKYELCNVQIYLVS